MRPSSAVLAAVTLLVGVSGGVLAYDLASRAGESTPPTGPTAAAVSVDGVSARTERGTRVRWAPCKAPAVLRGDTCVTKVVRTLTLPAAPSAVGTAGAAAVPASQDDADGHEDDDGYEAEDDDYGQDDDEDDHGHGHEGDDGDERGDGRDEGQDD